MKLTSVLSFTLSLASIALLVACGDNNNDANSSDKDQVTYPGLTINLPARGQGSLGWDESASAETKANISEDLRLIATHINKGIPVSFKMITKQFEIMHAKERNNPDFGSDKVSDFVSELARELNPSDLHAMKVELDKRLEKRAGKEIKYNRDAVSLVDVATTGKLQCYSGSSLQQVTLRSLTAGQDFHAQNYVLIFEEGHILPGYVTKEGNLIGIEMTAKGRAEVQYGPVKDVAGALRVVDAAYWMVAEIFKTSATNTQEIAQAILDLTAKKYGINLGNFAYASTGGTAATGGATTAQVLNSSPFSFGTPRVPAGDITRSSIETIQRSKSGNPAIVATSVAAAAPNVTPSAASFDPENFVLFELKVTGAVVRGEETLEVREIGTHNMWVSKETLRAARQDEESFDFIFESERDIPPPLYFDLTESFSRNDRGLSYTKVTRDGRHFAFARSKRHTNYNRDLETYLNISSGTGIEIGSKIYTDSIYIEQRMIHSEDKATVYVYQGYLSLDENLNQIK